MTNTVKLISKLAVAIGFASAIAFGMATPSFAQVDDNGSNAPNGAYERSFSRQDPSSFFNKGGTDEGRHAYGSAAQAFRAQPPANEPANIRIQDEQNHEWGD